MILLDTHAWVWWLTRDIKLSSSRREALNAMALSKIPCLASISLWEAKMLHSKGRVLLPLPFGTWLQKACSSRVVKILQIDVPVILALNGLPGSFHGDPADRLIVATAQAHGLSVATADEAIQQSKLVKIWNP